MLNKGEQINYLKNLSFAVNIAPLSTNIDGINNEAAVLVALFWSDQEEWNIILTKRADGLSKHPGEIAFPGGKVDPADKSFEDTALRESYEEINLVPEQVDIIGRIDPTMTRYMIKVHPIVGLVSQEVLMTLIANPAEVSEIFAVPLSIFFENSRFTPIDLCKSHDPESGYRIYEIAHKNYKIQGITASICIKAASIVYNREPSFDFKYPVHQLSLIGTSKI